jgi:hypothetical protein
LSKDGLNAWCRACHKIWGHQRYENNKEHCRKQCKKWRDSHKEEHSILNKKWMEKNREHRTRYKREYRKYKAKNDPYYQLRRAICRRFRDIMRRKHNSENALILVGCSLEDLRKYLEAMFQDGMTWTNYGEWHIDHIRPISSFNLTNEEEVKQCFHYTNLQPLWAKDNLKKSNKYNVG